MVSGETEYLRDMREELETVAERCGIEIEKDMAASECFRLTQS
jgi:hypothetical protein